MRQYRIVMEHHYEVSADFASYRPQFRRFGIWWPIQISSLSGPITFSRETAIEAIKRHHRMDTNPRFSVELVAAEEITK